MLRLPYYRELIVIFGSDDGNPHLVGSHFLSKGLDSGQFFITMSNNKTNVFDYTMSSVKVLTVERIKDKSIFKHETYYKTTEVRYSKK